MADLPVPKDRKLFFTSSVTQESISTLTTSIIEINESDRLLTRLYDVYDIKYTPKPIEIYIDSYGGGVYHALGLVSIMNASKTPIHTYATGVAMSAAFLMLIYGHKRFAHEHSTMLYHQVSSWSRGKLHDMVDDIKQSKAVQKKMETLVLDRTKIPKETLKSVYKERRDWFITAKEALKLGIIDEII